MNKMEMPTYLEIERMMQIVSQYGWVKRTEIVREDEIVVEIVKQRDRVHVGE